MGTWAIRLEGLEGESTERDYFNGGEGILRLIKKPGSREPIRKSTTMTSTKMPSNI